MKPNKPYHHGSKALLLGIVLLAGSTAFANINVDADGGAFLKIDNSSTNAPALNVGINFQGNSLIVTNAGSVTVDKAFIGSKDASENSVIITGTGSYLRATASMVVGSVDSTGNTLVIKDGASIYVGDMNTSLVGGGISVGSTNETASLSLGSGTTATAETLLIGTQSNETGSVTLSGTDTTLDLAGDLLIGTAGSDNTMTVDSGATLTVGNELQIGSTNSTNNRLLINSGGSAIILGATTINGAPNSINVASGGHLGIIEGMDLDTTTNGFNISSGASLQLGGVLATASLDRNIDITLDGPGASWTTTGDMYIGYVTNGNKLVLQDGAAITNGAGTSLYVGYESNNNELLVSGTNSHLKAQGTTYIGSKSDNNSLTIEESGSADIDGVLYVGNTPGASGNKVYVRSGGQLSVQTNIVIGANGSSNHLNIEEGGKLVAKENIIIGRETGAKSNTMTVSGSNTTVSVANDLIVGKLGSSNTMTLQGGTTTVDGNLMIGVEGASNTATVTGSNTVLTASGLTVGQTGGSNKFYLKEGASVTFSNDVVFGQSSNDNLLDVLGSNSTFNALANLTVGENGENNSLSIKGGTANIGIDLVIGATSNNNSTVVTGANSILNVGGAFYVGQNSSSNTLTISQGGKANAFNADIGATSNLVGNTVTISGKNSLLYVTNNLAIGSNSGSNNAVNVNSGGTLFVGNGISIGTATNDLNNRLNVNSGGTLQTIDWDFATVSTNILLKKGSTLELGGTLSNTNQVEGGIGIALNGSLATNNAIWNTGTDILHVGYGTGANSLTVKNGGFATTETNLVVGQSAKSTGNTLTATGMASRVFVGNDLVIGNKDSSSNHMKILGGGKIDVANNLVLGLKSGSNTGLLEGFAGTNSFLNITNNLIVGSEGSNNTLTISSNATVHVLSLATIGSDANNNTLKLTGSNAVFTVESNLVVGAKAASNNKLEISEGTANLNHDLIIGANTNSHDNTVGVYGSNSTLNIANDLYVGKEGSNNQLEITDALTTVYGNAFVGFGTNSRNNAIVVSGTNSIFNVASNLYAGYGGGLNSLSAESGALVNITNDAYIGFASSNNWISVSGSNSTLNVWNNLFVGNSATNISGDNAFRVLEAATAHIDGNLSLSKGELEIGSGSQVTVSGNYDQDEFSTLVLGISTNSPTTNLVVGGTAGFAKGTSIKIDLGDTEVRMGETNKYAQTLVSATDGLKVDGNTATTESLNNEALIVINPDSLIDVNLIVTNDTIAIANLIRLSIASRSGLIGTPLEPVADEIDAMADGSNDVAQVMRDILNDLGSDGRNTAMNDYYGEKQSSVPTHNLINQGIGGFANQLTMRGDNTRARMAATAPAGAAGPHSAGQELQGWIAGFGTRFNESASDGFDGYDGSTHGFLIGTDLSVAENILVGIAGGSGDSSVDKDNGASSDAKTTYGAIYASLGTKDWFVDTSLIYGSSSIDNTLGSLFDTTASYDAKNIAFFLGGGKEMIGDYLIITPQASILGNYYKQDAYEEKSTTAVGRSVDSFDTLYVQSAVGCSLGVYMGLGEMTLKPELSAHWLHEFNASNETLPYSLIGGTGTYSMELQAPEEDILKLGIGMSAKMSEYLELRADLDTRRGSDYSDYTMFGSIRYQF